MKILNIVDAYLEKKDKEQIDSKVRTSHHPSGYSNCMRQMFYDWAKAEVTNYRTATDIYRMKMGEWIHKGFAEILKEMFGDAVKDEVEFYYHDKTLKYPIHGYIDNTIEVDGKIYAVELKTSFGRGIVSIAKDGKPKPEHEDQSKIYLACNKDIKEFSIPYLGRDSFYRTEFDVKLSVNDREMFLEQVVAKFRMLEYHIERGVTPPRDFNAVIKDGEIKKSIQYNKVEYKSDWQCLYCIYRDGCWRKEISSMKTHIKKDEAIGSNAPKGYSSITIECEPEVSE